MILEKLRKLDEELMVFLNGLHSPFWDEVMLKATDRFFWIPFYALIVLFLIWKYKKCSILIIVSISLMVISADQITSSFMKPFFERARPCYNESLTGILRVINGCGGKYGFVSSHAANTFALVSFLVLLLSKNHKWIYLLWIWCTMVSYSRIYLGVHYPGDILGGAIVGMLLGFTFFRGQQWLQEQNKLKILST